MRKPKKRHGAQPTCQLKIGGRSANPSSAAETIRGAQAQKPQPLDDLLSMIGAPAVDFANVHEAIIVNQAVAGKESGKENGECRDAALLAQISAALAGLGTYHEPIMAMVFESFNMIEQTAKQLRLTDEERLDGISNLLVEVARRMPQIAKALFLTALLPTLSAHTLRYFHYNRGMKIHDAEDMSQKFSLKVLSALWGPWPRKNKNAGAWLAEIAANAHVDEIRKESREKIAVERLKRAAERIRR